MLAAWIITIGGAVAGLGGLLVRDHMVKRRQRGLPMVAKWLWKIALAMPVIGIFLGSLLFPLVPCPGYLYPAYRSASKSNLSQLGKAMAMYADIPGNGGIFPRGSLTPTDSLWLVYPDIVDDCRIFWDPRDRGNTPSGAPKICEDGTRGRVPAEYLAATGYLYVEGYGPDDADKIVAYERRARDGGRNVLYGSGTVEWMEEAGFQQGLAGQFNYAPTGGAPSIGSDPLPESPF